MFEYDRLFLALARNFKPAAKRDLGPDNVFFNSTSHSLTKLYLHGHRKGLQYLHVLKPNIIPNPVREGNPFKLSVHNFVAYIAITKNSKTMIVYRNSKPSFIKENIFPK